MEFKSAEPGFSVAVSRNDLNNPHSTYTVRIQANTQFGGFFGENTGLHFSAFPAFICRLKEFLETRTGEATLDLTEESELTFFRWNSKGDVGIRFKLSRYAYFGDPMQTHPLTLAGAFPLTSEYLNQMYSEVAQLVDA